MRRAFSMSRLCGAAVPRILAFAAAILALSASAAEDPISRTHAATVSPAGLLKQRHFTELDRLLLAVQRDYESDPQQAGRWYRAFGFARQIDPALEAPLSEWVGKSPTSYAAHFARGSYYATLAWDVRGDDVIDKTPPQQLRKMEMYFQKALPDLERSLTLAPRPLLSYSMLIEIGKHFSWAEKNRAWLDAANALDPGNILVRRSYLLTLRPQWGGSLEAMRSFVDESKQSPLADKYKNQLESDIWRARALRAKLDGDHHAAVNHYSTAIGLYDQDSRLWVNRALEYEEIKQPENALRDYTHALVLSPDYVFARNRRGWLLKTLGRYDEALDDLNRVLKVDPKNADAWSSRGNVYFLQGRHQQAVADYRRAAELGDPWAQHALGSHYWFGKGVEQSRDKAIHWWKIAARNGNAQAVHDLRVEGIIP